MRYWRGNNESVDSLCGNGISGRCNRLFPDVKIVEYRREVRAGDTLWDICGEIATDKEDLRKLVYQAKKDNGIRDVGDLQPGMLIVVRVEEARK